MQRMVLTAATPAGPKILEEITAGAPLGDDRRARRRRSQPQGCVQFNAAGQFVAAFASGRVSRLAVSVTDNVAMLDTDSKSIIVADHAGKTLVTIRRGAPVQDRITGRRPLRHVRERLRPRQERVLVFGANGKLLTVVTPRCVGLQERHRSRSTARQGVCMTKGSDVSSSTSSARGAGLRAPARSRG
jgi:hypothetical protein